MNTTTTPAFWRTTLIREPAPEAIQGKDKCKGPAGVAALWAALYSDIPHEQMVAFLLDTQHRVRGVHVITSGILDAALVHPREVFRPAILANAAAVILAHNHPSGDPAPSPEDRNVARQCKEAGAVIGIRLLDCLVVTDSGAWETCMP